jgi:pyrroline-5-carboxylate reductase
VRCVADSSELTETDVIVLAVKPQIMPTVLPVVSHVPGCEQALVISIAAGLNTSTIEQGLPNHIRVVRAMPNTPLLVGMGATTLCAGSCASEQDMALARDLFGCIGMALIVDESLMDVTGAINGSGPAYVAALVEAMAAGAVEQGLSADVAESLAIQTVVGTGSLMALKHQSAKQTRIEVCSPGGTTLAALDAMETGGFSDSIRSGVKAAVRRSRELGAQ